MSFQQKFWQKSFWLLFVVVVMIIITLAREIFFFPKLDTIPNPDVSWLLYAAGRVADGQKLYIDMMETNPPLIVWLYLLPVWIGRLLDISIFTVFPLLVTLLNVVSLLLVAKIMRGQELLSKKPVFQGVLLYIAFGFFLLSPALYGQRELLFITLVLPYLLKSLDNDGEEKKFSVRNLIIIFMAAIGFAIKPFFMLLWGMNELHNAIQKRNFWSIFSFGNWFIGIFQLSYLAVIYSFTPEYLGVIIPVLLSTYFPYESSLLTILKFVSIVSVLVFFIAWLAQLHGEFRSVIWRILVWMLACVGIILLQRKDWLNHLYPLVFMAGLAVTVILLYLHEIWQDIGLSIGYRKFTALCAAIATLLSCVWVDGKFWVFIYQHPSVIHTKLLEEINKRATGKNVYSLTFNMQAAFPVIAVSKGILRGSFQQLWPMGGLIIREQQEIKTPELEKARQFFYDTIVHDFAKYPPELVWVDENVNMDKIVDYDIEPENRNIIKVLSRDVRFAVLWNDNYEKVGEIEGEPPDPEEIAESNQDRKPERYSLYTRIKK